MISMASLLLLSVGIWLASFLLKVTYRLSPLHPLYAFPGPRFAKATYLYEIYFDLVKGGLYTQEIQRLHNVYGPFIQINPDGLHCNDPYFVDEIYAGGGNRKRNKPFLQVRFLVGAYVQFDPPNIFLSLPTLLLPSDGRRFTDNEPNTSP